MVLSWTAFKQNFKVAIQRVMVLPWTASKQNFKAGIQSAEIDLQLAEKELAEKEMGGTELEKQRIEKCKIHLSNARAAYKTFPSRQILVLQNLLAIRQNLLLVLPIEEILAQWSTIARRLEQLKGHSHNVRRKAIQNRIDKFIKLESSKRESATELGIRHDIREARRFTDERRVVAFWHALATKRQSRVLLILGLALLLVLTVVISCERGFPAICLKLLVDPQTLPTHSIIATVLAGGLGGVVSTYSNLQAGAASAPPFSGVNLLRPIIGGVAGLFVWLVSAAGAIQFTYPILYASALATGFSERLFYRQLRRFARTTDKQISQSDEPETGN